MQLRWPAPEAASQRALLARRAALQLAVLPLRLATPPRPALAAQEWVAVQVKKEVRLKELEAKAAALEQGQEVRCWSGGAGVCGAGAGGRGCAGVGLGAGGRAGAPACSWAGAPA